jgi:hypothetical protein
MHSHPHSMRLRVAVGLIALVGSLVTVAVAAGAAAGATTSPHAAKAHQRVLPIAGSSKLLVYATATSATALHSDELNQYLVLHALTSSGRRVRLGALGVDGQVSVLGSNIDLDSRQDNQELVRWWDVANGKHGSLETTEGAFRATPDGWLYDVNVGGSADLVTESYSGQRADLGDPLPPGVGYFPTTGSAGIVSSADNDEDGNGEITFMAWSDPGVFHTLLKAGDTENFCGGVSSTVAVCQLNSGAAAIFPLDGSTPTIKKTNCVREPIAYRSAAVWTSPVSSTGCPKGRLGELTSKGTVSYSAQIFSGDAVVAALGRIVVASAGQRDLLTLTSARATPKLLLHAS